MNQSKHNKNTKNIEESNVRVVTDSIVKYLGAGMLLGAGFVSGTALYHNHDSLEHNTAMVEIHRSAGNEEQASLHERLATKDMAQEVILAGTTALAGSLGTAFMISANAGMKRIGEGSDDAAREHETGATPDPPGA